jgi:hypothetical protein
VSPHCWHPVAVDIICQVSPHCWHPVAVDIICQVSPHWHPVAADIICQVRRRARWSAVSGARGCLTVAEGDQCL